MPLEPFCYNPASLMPRTALVSCYVHGQKEARDDFAALATHFATLLKQAGDEVCVIAAYPDSLPIRPDPQWRQNLRSRDIELVELQNKPPRGLWPDIWATRLSEQVAPLLRAFDVVYFSDLANLAFHTVRVKRFTSDAMPVCVTVLQGPSRLRRLRGREYPRIPEDLNIDFVEQYSASHSDFVVASAQHILDWVNDDGWQFEREPLVLPLPSGAESAGAQFDLKSANESWLDFHHLACKQARMPRSAAVGSSSPKLPAIDVCVPYYNKPRQFPQLLESLERQTIQNFTVIAVDDGSPDAEARAVFDAMAEKYRPRGWTFFRQPNSWVDAARNQAAKHGEAPYLLMIDADDVPARNALERMLEAARLSGDDCLVSASCLFAGDGLPYDTATGELAAPVFGYYMPLGANLLAGLFEPEVFGGPMILIRRETFEALGGYRELRGAAHEDWELHARLALAGYKTDVLPEYLHFYRQLEDGLSRTSDDFLAKRRIIETYDKHFASVKVYGVATAMYGMCRQWRNLERKTHGEDRGLGLATSGLGQSDGYGMRRFEKDHEGPLVVRLLRRTYRRAIPLSARLRFHERLMKLFGRDASAGG